MPTETDAKLAGDIADLRVGMERRFGEVEQRLAAIQAELGLIRKLGDRLLGDHWHDDIRRRYGGVGGFGRVFRSAAPGRADRQG